MCRSKIRGGGWSGEAVMILCAEYKKERLFKPGAHTVVNEDTISQYDAQTDLQ